MHKYTSQSAFNNSHILSYLKNKHFATDKYFVLDTIALFRSLINTRCSCVLEKVFFFHYKNKTVIDVLFTPVIICNVPF